MVEGHLVQRRRRGIRRDVTADARMFFVGPHHHRHRIPANDALDAAFQFPVPRILRLLVGRNAVDVGRIQRHGTVHPFADRPLLQHGQQVLGALGPLAGEHVLERLQPFRRFVRIRIRDVVDEDVGIGRAHGQVSVCISHGRTSIDCRTGYYGPVHTCAGRTSVLPDDVSHFPAGRRVSRPTGNKATGVDAERPRPGLRCLVPADSVPVGRGFNRTV